MSDNVLGHRIVELMPLPKKVLKSEGWDGNAPPIAIKLDNGTILYPSQDGEGNGPGVIFGTDKKGESFGLFNRGA